MKTCSTNLPIFDISPFTLLDYPDNTACIIWFSGCNMRCPYCHNPEMVKSKGRASVDAVIEFLQKRKGLLEGVVFSGGEATGYPDIIALARKIKTMGYKIKLDTNGTHPDVVQKMLEDRLANYIALDYKAPVAKYSALTRHNDFSAFAKTLDMLIANTEVNFEVRTTVHTDLLDESDINAIIKDLSSRGYKGTYYVQNYTNNNDNKTLGDMPKQQRQLDVSKILTDNGVKVEFRGFSIS